jgi:hypothetical protein
MMATSAKCVTRDQATVPLISYATSGHSWEGDAPAEPRTSGPPDARAARLEPRPPNRDRVPGQP